MSKTPSIFLIIIGGLIVMCLIVVVGAFFLFGSARTVLKSTLKTDTDKTVEIAGSIAEFTIPAEFSEPYATRLVGFSMVQYNHSDGHSHISFFQIPRAIHIDEVEMERQFRQTEPRENRRGKVIIKLVDEVQATIMGQEVTLMISEGTNSDGEPYRECSGIFEGKGGQAMVIYEAPLSSWDQAEVDALLASIH